MQKYRHKFISVSLTFHPLITFLDTIVMVFLGTKRTEIKRKLMNEPCMLDKKAPLFTQLISITIRLFFLPSNLRSRKLSPNTFPTEMKPSKCPAKGGKKAKGESRDYRVTLNPTFLLSSHARTSETDILHLD